MLSIRVVVAGILVAGLSAAAMAQPVNELLAVERELNEMCRGWSGDDPHTDQVCALRDKVFKALQRSGYCYGRPGQAGAEMRWQRCGPTSPR